MRRCTVIGLIIAHKEPCRILLFQRNTKYMNQEKLKGFFDTYRNYYLLFFCFLDKSKLCLKLKELDKISGKCDFSFIL